MNKLLIRKHKSIKGSRELKQKFSKTIWNQRNVNLEEGRNNLFSNNFFGYYFDEVILTKLLMKYFRFFQTIFAYINVSIVHMKMSEVYQIK